MHYGSQSCQGLNMQAPLELLVMEMGLSLQPFKENYNTCQHRVMLSWMKSVWEKASILVIEIQIAPLPLQPLQEHDSWIMAEFIRLNYDTQSLQQLNRVRIHQQVIFLLDVMDASERALEKKYQYRRPTSKQWTTLIFPKEDPSRSDFHLMCFFSWVTPPVSHTYHTLDLQHT
jgi:hypothetical protein